MMANGGQVIEKVELFPVRIPYPRVVQWASLAEDAANYMLLKVTTRDGLVGVAEGTVKVTWTSATHRSLATIFEELFAPLLVGAALDDDKHLARVWAFKEHSLAKAMIDIALWDLRAQVAGQPLWAMWGGDRDPAVSWVVTRQAPDVMAREAERMVSTYGIGTLKVKGGQGLATDLAALDAIRAAVGDGVVIYVDPNGEYSAAETPNYVARVADKGAVMVEDPCRLQPNAGFAQLQAACPIPLLVDGDCRNLAMTKLFAERGARAFNLKLSKARGFSENRAIVEFATARRIPVNIGLFAETSLGALAALQLSASLPGRATGLPGELCNFLMLPDEFVHEPLTVKAGRVRLPDSPGFDQIIDWRKVERLRP